MKCQSHEWWCNMKNALMVAAVLWLAACSPEVPAAPSYAKDVQPILMAHCVRCHGEGDTLNTNPDVTSVLLPAPRQCYLQRFGDEGDCTDRNNLTACMSGAQYCGTLMTSLVGKSL